jgi:hypothetical protein
MFRFFSLTVLSILVLFVAFGCSNDPNPVSSSKATPVASANRIMGAIPADAVIDSARIYVHLFATDTQAVTVHQITSSWDEAAVTWTAFGAAYDTALVNSFMAEDTGWYNIDVTSQVQGWFDSTFENFGFMLQPDIADTGLTTQIDSREASANQPFLEVFYTTHDGTWVDTLETAADAYIYSAEADSNFGSDTALMVEREVGEDSLYQSLIQFDFSVVVRTVSLGDYVWLDANGDGLQDDDESGVEGVTVNLYSCDDSSMVATTMTDSDGMYSFDSLMAGDYYIEVIAPDNYMFTMADVGDDDTIDSDVDPTTGLSDCVTLLPGDNFTDLDAGLVLVPGSIGDYVWNDENENGLQDEGESGMAGIEVRLYTCDGTLMDSTMSDSSGMYMFESVEAGDYYLEFVNPDGYIFTYQDVGDDDAIDSDVDRYQKRTECFTIANGDELDSWDAGLYAYDGCTYGKGYWKNHTGMGPQDDEVTKLLPIWLGDKDGDKSLLVNSADTAYLILQQHYFGEPKNGITKLYAHLLTAKLNIMNFANPSDIEDIIAEADAFLAEHDWTDWDSLSKSERHDVLQWMGMNENYNEGDTGPGQCGDDYDDDYDSHDWDFEHNWDYNNDNSDTCDNH